MRDTRSLAIGLRRGLACALLLLALVCSRAHRAIAHPIHDDDDQAALAESPQYSTRVLGGYTEATATERTVEQKSITALPRRSGDDLLRFVPGILLSQHGSEGKGYQIFLRGFDAVHGSDLEVTVEGIGINELSNVHGQGYLDLGFVIPETVLTLRAAKGSFQTWQGNFATAGSVRLKLGVPEALRGVRTSYEVGSTNRHRVLAVLAPRGQDERTFFALEYLRDGGFGTNRAAERLNVQGQLVLLKRGAHRLEAMAVAYTARFGEPGVVPLADVRPNGKLGFFDVYSKDTFGESHRALAQLRYQYQHHHDRLELALYGKWRRARFDENFTGYLLSAEHGDERLQRHEAAGAGVIARWERRLHRTLQFQSALALDTEVIRQGEDQLDVVTKEPWKRSRELSASQLAFNLQVGLAWHPLRWLHLNPGVRVDAFAFDVHDHLDPDRSNRANAAQVSPRLNGAVFLPRGVSLFFAYGRGLRAPEARAVLRRLPNQNENVPLSEYQGGPAKLTTSDGFEVGLRYRNGTKLELGAATFGTWISNENVFDHIAGINLNLNQTRRLGGELELRYQPVSFLELRADMTYVDARFVASGAPVPNAPTGLGTLAITFFGWRGFSAGARAVFLLPRPLAHGATASGYITVDLRAGYRWRFLSFDLDLTNLTNTRWREGEFHYASWFDKSAQPRSELPARHFTAGPPFVARGTLTAWF